MRWLALVLLVGCVEAPIEMSEYPCPESGTQLTYENFGKAFLDTECNTCHASSTGNRPMDELSLG